MEDELWKEAQQIARELGLHEQVLSEIDPDDEFFQEHPDYAYVNSLLTEIHKKYGNLDAFKEFFEKFEASDLFNLLVADVIFHEPELAKQVKECFEGWFIMSEDGELTEEGRRFLEDFGEVEH